MIYCSLYNIRKMGKNLALSPDLPAILGMDFAGTFLLVMRFMAVLVA